MTKRKLSTAGFIGLSMILMAAKKDNHRNYHLAAQQQQTDPIPAQPIRHTGLPSDSLKARVHLFDSTGLCHCLPLSEDEFTDAPKVRLNTRATTFVHLYLKKNSRNLTQIKVKSKRYFPVMDSVFRMYDLPVELKYLAVVESELKNTARSGVGAVGLWQLMPSTARLLGLKVRPKYDERKHTYSSTRAAAKYLRYLHNQFGDWLLTIAAYNSGPGPVYSAIRKSGSRNFWKLQAFLPAETRGHVKRFIATQYFFEGKGSVTVLTKAETEAHIKAVTKFLEKREKEKEVVKSIAITEVY